jgi:hypothetical protein
MKKGVFLILLLSVFTGGAACKKRTPISPAPSPAPIAVEATSLPPEVEVEPVPLEPAPIPEPDDRPARVPLAPALEAELLFAHGEMQAAESAYLDLLETSLDGPMRGRILLHLAMIYADPSIALYDPKKSLDFLNAIEEADPVDRSEAATLSHLLERLLELEADRQSIRRALERVEQELEKLKSIDERRIRRP